jgi:hypothetical protein
MSQDRDKIVYDDNVADVLKMQGYSTYESPRSIYRVDKLYEALSKYAPINMPTFRWSHYFQAGVALAHTCFGRPTDVTPLSVLPFTPETVAKVTSEPKASAGLTAFGQTKAESQMRALERGLQTLKMEKAAEPCIAYSRTQFEEKTRLVWGFPYSMTVVEGTIAYPLMQMFKKGTTPMAFAMTTCSLGTRLRTASYSSKWAYSIDYSGFDSSIHPRLIKEAFNILRSWFDLEQVEPISGKTIGDIFRCVEWYFIHTPIVMPDSKLYLGKKHGVPSGSFFTQIIDSIVNVMLAESAAARFNLHVPKRGLFVLGDDLLMWSNREVDLEKIAEFVTSEFGVTMNGPPKSQRFRFDEAVTYLGRIWSNGLPTLDLDGILKRMIYPERFRKYSDDQEARYREVKLLILSYAAVYLHGWGIAQKTLGSDLWFAQGPERIESAVYSQQSDGRVNPEHLSGLQRYLEKHVRGERQTLITATATQYCM